MDQKDMFDKDPQPNIVSWEDLDWFRLGSSIEMNKKLNLIYLTEEVFPPRELVFRAFELTPLEGVKVVILGQDPYHTKGKAMGLAFSVPEGEHHPPSLRNIFRELQFDCPCRYPTSGDLTPWAKQGVLLLNTILTVKAGSPLSHDGLGWDKLVHEVIRVITQHRTGVVFILWGNHAIGTFLDSIRGLPNDIIPRRRHTIISTAHPSPFSASRGFEGSQPFSRANEALVETSQEPIQWCLM